MGEGGAPPSLFLHCVEVYDRIAQDATPIPTDGEDALVWEGYFTKVITQDLGFAIPYYTRITQALKGMGSCIQLKRGGGTSPSRWQLCRPPTLDLFDIYENRSSSRAVSKTAQQGFQIKDLGERVDVLEDSIGEILGMLREVS